MSADVGRCFPRPLPRKRRNPACPVKGCKRSTQTGGQYCYHHSNACECGNRITPDAKRCRECSDKASSGTQMSGLFKKPTVRLAPKEQIESMIEAYQQRIAAKRDDAEFCKKRITELQAQLRLMDKA